MTGMDGGTPRMGFPHEFESLDLPAWAFLLLSVPKKSFL
jgi:hypothetical protein